MNRILILLISILPVIPACVPQPSDIARLDTPVAETQRQPSPVPPSPRPDPNDRLRESMVDDQIAARGISDELVLNAMKTVPRHLFVPEDYRNQAYDDHPLPIGYGQTISQPYIVALMSESLQLDTGTRVLEIGTGSGYQAAVLAEMGMEVYSVEIIPELATRAQDQLHAAGYEHVLVSNADGYYGWEAYAPFDAIIVTAAPDHLPQPLANQLAEGGRLVIPIGPIGTVQSLWLFHKLEGELEATNLGPVRFVPFTRASEP